MYSGVQNPFKLENVCIVNNKATFLGCIVNHKVILICSAGRQPGDCRWPLNLPKRSVPRDLCGHVYMYG